MQHNTLKRKTLSGLFWSFSGLIINQAVQFIIQIILARLLLPEDFGIIGMVTVFIAVAQVFVECGFVNSLVRETSPTQEDYSTVFYFNLIMAVITYVILFISANVISEFLNEPRLIGIVRIVSITIIISSFGLVQTAMLLKSLNFKVVAKINVLSSIISGVIAIIYAILGFGFWSLVIKSLSMQFIQSVLLCINNKWRPSCTFNTESFKKYYGFGWKLMVSGIIDTFYNNFYYLIIGKLFSVKDLGFYSNAQKLNDTAAQSITSSIQKVSYPVLSSLNDNVETLKNAYRKIIRASVFVNFPFMMGLAAIANPMITVLFGAKWVNSITYFQILCFAGMIYPLHAINLNMLQVKGRSDLFLGLEIVKKVIGVASILFVIYLRLSISGLLWTAVVISFLNYFVNSYYSEELISYSFIEQIKDIAPIFTAAVLMSAAVYILGIFLPVSNIIKLGFQILLGIALYTSMCFLFKIEEVYLLYELKKLLLK